MPVLPNVQVELQEVYHKSLPYNNKQLMPRTTGWSYSQLVLFARVFVCRRHAQYLSARIVDIPSCSRPACVRPALSLNRLSCGRLTSTSQLLGYRVVRKFSIQVLPITFPLPWYYISGTRIEHVGGERALT